MTTKTKAVGHTPGPWRVCGGYTAHYAAIHSDAGYIVFGFADALEDKVRGEPIQCPDYETQRANARLIAAAPDLLVACKEIEPILRRNLYPCPDKPHSDWAKASRLFAAIAKAEGSAP